MPAAAAVPVTGSGAVLTKPGVYQGFWIRDTSGAVNTVKLFDNDQAASGTIIASFQLAANADKSDAPSQGVFLTKGLFIQATGAIEGSVRV